MARKVRTTAASLASQAATDPLEELADWMNQTGAEPRQCAARWSSVVTYLERKLDTPANHLDAFLLPLA